MKRKVLIVEDNFMNMELTTQLLEDDYELILATNGKHGVEQAIAHRPDVIIMDLSLPVMDGWQAIQALRRKVQTTTIPILALSAHAGEGDIARALAAGANEYLTKPVDEELLLAAVKRLMRIWKD